VEQQTHSLWPNQEQLLFYINYLLTFIQFSDFYQEAIFLGQNIFPKFLQMFFKIANIPKKKKPLIKNVAPISHLSLLR